MKLWILKPNDNLPVDNPWSPWYDKVFGFVIRAKTEKEAREMANNKAKDENKEGVKNVWLNPKYSKCIVLRNIGKIEIIMRDFKSA